MEGRDLIIRNKAKGERIHHEGRSFRRFDEKGSITLRFASQSAQGVLINISLTGVLGLFSVSERLPKILKRVKTDLKFDNNTKIADLEAVVVRIHASHSSLDAESIEMALTFAEMSPEKRHELKNYISLLVKKAKGCPYFR